MSWSSDTIDKKGTNGLSELQIDIIKSDHYMGRKVGFIADNYNLTTEQVVYAINLNEEHPTKFTLADFEI